MVRRMKKTVVMALFLGCGLGCGGGAPSKPATLGNVQQDVFALSCTFSSCHSSGAAKGGLVLEPGSFGKLVNVGAVGAPGRRLVVPGQPDASYLLEKLTSDRPAAGARMPPGGIALEAERVELVRAWIQAGAQND